MIDEKTKSSVPLYLNESIEDLQRNGMKMIQPSYGFRFGEDSVLLAAIAAGVCTHTSRRIHVADLGAGSGSVSVLMAARNRMLKISAIELDQHRFDCLRRNIELNDLSGSMHAYNLNIRKLIMSKQNGGWPDGLKPSQYDIVVMNPPYRVPAKASVDRFESGDERERSSLMAGEELTISLEELMMASARLLKFGGRLVMVHRPQRLPDIIGYMRQAAIEPVTLQVMESLPAKAPSRLIIIGRKGIKSGGFRWLAPLTVYSKPGQMTDEAADLYGHEPCLSEEQLMSGVIRLNQEFTAAASTFARIDEDHI